MQRLYARFSELLGLSDHLQVLNVIVTKIATNLKCYVEVTIYLRYYCRSIFVLEIKIGPSLSYLHLQSTDVITHTLKVFLEMASGLVSDITFVLVGFFFPFSFFFVLTWSSV